MAAQRKLQRQFTTKTVLKILDSDRLPAALGSLLQSFSTKKKEEKIFISTGKSIKLLC